MTRKTAINRCKKLWAYIVEHDYCSKEEAMKACYPKLVDIILSDCFFCEYAYNKAKQLKSKHSHCFYCPYSQKFGPCMKGPYRDWFNYTKETNHFADEFHKQIMSL